MSGSTSHVSVCVLAGLLVSAANANVLIDNFQEGSVNIQAGPFTDAQIHWVESIETGLSPANVIGGTRRTSVAGFNRDSQSAHLAGGAMHFQLDENLIDFDAGLYYGSLGGVVLDGAGIAFDINYEDGGGPLTATNLRLALMDTHGRSGTLDVIAGQGHDQRAVSGTYEFAFDGQFRNRVDLMSIDGIGLSLMSNTVFQAFAIDNIRVTPEPGTILMLVLAGGAGLWRRRRA